MLDDAIDQIDQEHRKAKPYEYWVSYSHPRGFGAYAASLDGPIDSLGMVEEIRRVARESVARVLPRVGPEGYDIVILGWILLSGPEDGSRAAVQRVRDLADAMERESPDGIGMHLARQLRTTLDGTAA